MAKDPHDRKRKKLLEEKKRKVREAEALVYKGDLYKKARFTPTWLQTEIAIYEAYVLSQHQISDNTVAAALENLIVQLRGGDLPPLPEKFGYEQDREEDLIIENIRRRWNDHFADAWKPSDADLIGVLRSILGTIDTMKSPFPKSYGYMRYITEFLTKKVGVSVKAMPAQSAALLEEEPEQPVLIGSQADADA